MEPLALLEGPGDLKEGLSDGGNGDAKLGRNGRLGEIGAINDRFESVLEERSGVVAADIISARDLPDTERAAFQTNLEKLTGKKVNINYSVDKEIIGGVVTRIGSTVYDGSVKTKLQNLKEQLVNG